MKKLSTTVSANDDLSDSAARSSFLLEPDSGKNLSPAASHPIVQPSFSKCRISDVGSQNQESVPMPVVTSVSSDSVASVVSSEEILKMCPRCPEGQNYKSLSEFSNDRSKHDGRYFICKECDKEKGSDRRRKRVLEEDVVDENDTEDTVDEAEGTVDDLYVMQNSCIMNQVKIGRSIDPEKRRRALQASQNFSMNILAVYHGAGHLEPLVHNILAYCRVHNVPGREWFNCPPYKAFGAIVTAMSP
jgi:hypothetical protein